MLTPEDEARAVTEVSERLTALFPEVSPEFINHTVRTSYEQFTGRPIRAFVPVLVERLAKTTLTDRLRTA